jgi:SAM-dependent methyltransferase
MLTQVKSLVRRSIRNVGFELVRPQSEIDWDAIYRSSFSSESLSGRRFYNIGAGAFRHKYWTNVDKASDWYRTSQGDDIGIRWDLLADRPLPVDDGRAEIVYTSHVVEHVTDEADRRMFAEAYRILRPGGVFRVTTPNIDLYHRAYRAKDRSFFYWCTDDVAEMERIGINRSWSRASIQQMFLYAFASSASTLHIAGAPCPIEDDEFDRLFNEMDYEAALNACVARCSIEVQQRFVGNHINWWNADKAFRMLREAGFSEVYLSAYGQSRSPVLRDTNHFDNTHPKISLYVEAMK